MKTSCINHPAKEPLIIIRKWQVEACDGNHCAAALLSFFEYWHNIRLEQSIKAAQANDIAERHGDGRTQDESFIQWHSSNDLERGLLGLYAHGKIAEAVNLLSGKGFIRTLRNPNPRYKFDATKHFVFNEDAVNEWIESRSSENGESIARKSETGSRKGKTVAQKREMTIGEETTSEITKETTEDTPADAGDVAKPESEPVVEKPKAPVKIFAEQWWGAYKRHNGMPYSPPNARREPRQQAKETDEAWLKGLESNPAYAGLDVAREHAKMVAWCSVNGKQPSRRRFVNWLNRAEKPMRVTRATTEEEHLKGF